jgi:hypothetical protein
MAGARSARRAASCLALQRLRGTCSPAANGFALPKFRLIFPRGPLDCRDADRSHHSHTGAEVRGLDLSQPISKQDRQALRAAFVDHHVLAIRGQSLSPASCCRRWRCSARSSPAQHPLRAARLSADPLPVEPGSFSRRPPLHSRRGLAHRSFE